MMIAAVAPEPVPFALTERGRTIAQALETLVGEPPLTYRVEVQDGARATAAEVHLWTGEQIAEHFPDFAPLFVDEDAYPSLSYQWDCLWVHISPLSGKDGRVS